VHRRSITEQASPSTGQPLKLLSKLCCKRVVYYRYLLPNRLVGSWKWRPPNVLHVVLLIIKSLFVWILNI